jgi:hypothetical protein
MSAATFSNTRPATAPTGLTVVLRGLLAATPLALFLRSL